MPELGMFKTWGVQRAKCGHAQRHPSHPIRRLFPTL